MKKLFPGVLLLFLCTTATAQVKLHLQLDTSIHRSLTGRLYIPTINDTSKRIPDSPNPSQAAFVFYLKEWTGIKTIDLNQNADHFPKDFISLKPGYYKVAGIIDVDSSERGNFNPGNVYARKEAILHVDENGAGEATLLFSSVVPQRVFKNSDSIQEVKLRSSLLSDFRKKDMFLYAGVRLPASYRADTSRQYPVVFIIPGWGGTHYDIQGKGPVNRYGMNLGKEKIYIYLNPENQSPFGLHAMVDSRVNGPWGKAFVEELIPELLKRYRINPDPQQHFVMGQSTGGYAALWLQLHYPGYFGGCWGVSPDPVDFHAYTGVNLYEKNANFFVDHTGKPRPIYRKNGVAESTLKASIDLENFSGDGGQQQAFEAEFGLPDASGRPMPLFNRQTGLINPDVVKSWEPYDLGNYIEQNWETLAPAVSGKIHVYAGSEDNFYLDEAVKILAQKAASVRAKLVAEVIQGYDHWSIWSADFTRRIQHEMDDCIR